MAKINKDLMTVAGIIRGCADRQIACNVYEEQFSDDTYDEHIYHIIDDYNIADHYLYGAIAKIATMLSTSVGIEDADEEKDLHRRFTFLVGLLTLPMPEGWDEEPWQA